MGARRRWMVVVLVVLGVAMGGCGGTEEEQPDSGLANPASVYCVEQGGTVEIRTDEAGNQAGVCVFDSGGECDEWAFYRGECSPQG